MSHPMTKPTKWHVRPAKISLGIPPRLIRVFAVRMKKPGVLSYPLSAQRRRLWSDWADAQADLSFRWAHRTFCWFCDETAQLLYWWSLQGGGASAVTVWPLNSLQGLLILWWLFARKESCLVFAFRLQLRYTWCRPLCLFFFCIFLYFNDVPQTGTNVTAKKRRQMRMAW